MTYSPPPDPHSSMPGPPGQAWRGSPPLKSPWPGVVALLLGLAGCGLPFLPIDLTGVRHLIALPLGLIGLLLGVLGCVGPRRGKPLAVVAIVWCFLAIALGAYMVIAFTWT